MYCRVVPLTRTPPGVEVFDYRIPKDLEISSGDLIVVPFRKNPMPALVLSTMQNSPFASKAQDVISRYGDIRFPLSIVEMLSYVASTTFTSKPAVIKAWLRNLPKRLPEASEHSSRKTVKKSKPSVTAFWALDHEAKLVERAKLALAKGERVLVLTPWKARIERLLSAIGQGLPYSSDLNDGDAFRAWSGFYRGETKLLVSTRLGGWLSPLADLVLLDEPENDDYKQDELAPRYDARKIAIWSAEHAGTIVEAHGLTPPLHSDEDAPEIEVDLLVVFRHPQGRGSIPMVQGEALNTLRDHEGPRIIVHPIKGDIARLTCRDCGKTVICPNCDFTLSADKDRAVCRRCGYKGDLSLQCSSCGGYDLGRSLPGIDRLKSAWKKYEDEVDVEWRGVSNADFEKALPENACVLLTDASLIGGGAEDVRRMEKLAVTFRRLARDVHEAKGLLIVQTEEHQAGFWVSILTTDGFKAFRERERATRLTFGYPPAKRLIKVIVETEDEKLLNPIKQLAEIRGPYPIPYRAKSRKSRYIWHILPKTNTVSRELLDALTILSKQALIDLDPIAFLR